MFLATPWAIIVLLCIGVLSFTCGRFWLQARFNQRGELRKSILHRATPTTLFLAGLVIATALHVALNDPILIQISWLIVHLAVALITLALGVSLSASASKYPVGSQGWDETYSIRNRRDKFP